MKKRYEVEFQQAGNCVAVFITDVIENMVIHDFIIPNSAMSQSSSSLGFNTYIELDKYISSKFGDVDYGY